MIVPGSANPLLASTDAGGYTIAKSLRLRSSASAYLNRTFSSGSQTTWTWSGWVKRGKLGTQQAIFNAPVSGQAQGCQFNSNDKLEFVVWTGSYVYQKLTTAVYRDPSAWYHIVFTLDTTNATASDRVRIYVNGSRVTAFDSSTDPSQNYAGRINSNVLHQIGADNSSSNPNDCYIADVNFIDGQALTPSSFGETDSVTGVWKPKRYTGTYGTNGFYLPFNTNNTSTYAGSFSGTNYLTLGGNSALALGSGNWTIEMWYYANSFGTYQVLYDGRPASTNGAYPTVSVGNDGAVRFAVNATEPIVSSTGIVTLNKWNHIAVVKNGSTITAYLNGNSVGSASDSVTYLCSGSAPYIGTNAFGAGNSTYSINGYISNLRVVKGTAVYTANFTPSTSPLTAIANTALLTLQNSSIVDNSTNALTVTNNGSVTTSVQYPFNINSYVANDQSGNGNNWTTNNISLVTGSTYDSMTDVPTLTDANTANYAVFSPLLSHSGTGALVLSNGNLRVGCSQASMDNDLVVPFPMNTGKWYWEVTITNAGSFSSGNGLNIGLNKLDGSLSTYRWISSSGSPVSTTYTTGDVLGFAYDPDAGTIGYYKNNTLAGTSTSVPRDLAPTVYIWGSNASSVAVDCNFGQQGFKYTPPTGFKALNTYNLPDSTIVAGNKVMDATLYTGNATARSITNTGAFKPDLVWIKSRSNAYNHYLVDSVRGASKFLVSNNTDADGTYTSGLTSFDANGFSLGTDNGSVNGSGATFVGWQWQAGQGTTSSNTNGSITSTVSVNANAGFSIVTYTGNGTAGATVGHGLGVAPKFIIIKKRSSTGDWQVYHQSVGNTAALFLNLTNAAYTTNLAWNNTSPTSSVFTLGSGGDLNGSGVTFVAYCWAEVAGFSKAFSYTGNGSTDGAFVYCGFRPKFILVKRTDSASDWDILDAARNTYNLVNNELVPNASAAEANYNTADFLSNGFKLRSTYGNTNASGSPYVGIAFAENPFKNSLAR